MKSTQGPYFMIAFMAMIVYGSDRLQGTEMTGRQEGAKGHILAELHNSGSTMGFKSATMTTVQLQAAIQVAVKYPHKKIHKGELIISPDAFTTPGRETNLVISKFARIDCTGSVHIGPWCNIGHRSRIYTHDTIHMGRRPLALVEEEFGIQWQDKHIGADVWIHDSAIVLYQASHIPDGVVIGAGSVLTKNPGPYEIWAGVPARKIGKREEVDGEIIRQAMDRKKFSLKQKTKEIT